jgi:enoyl-CoA hydratase
MKTMLFTFADPGNRIFSAESLVDSTKEILSVILSKAPLAVGLSLAALRMSDVPLEQGLEFEAVQFGQACGTSDFNEGVAAFLERRKPDFSGT